MDQIILIKEAARELKLGLDGAFKDRRHLLKVPALGDKTYEQAADFLKIPDASNSLDNTFIHPESYPAAAKLLSIIQGGATIKGETPEFPGQAVVKEFRRLKAGDIDQQKVLAGLIGIGLPTLLDILDNLEKPGRDPREELPEPLLRKDLLKLDDLSPGMKLTGTVRNVVDFGAFVDIGLKQDGLVHITEMSRHYVKHPLEIVGVGDIIQVKVLKLDPKRGRVSLSMKLD